MWTTTDRASQTIDVSVLAAVGARFGVQTWPVVLDIFGVFDAREPGDTATVSDAQIAASGLCDGDELTGFGATVLRSLSVPARVVEVRRYCADGVVRICLARSGHDHVLAVRTGTAVRVDVVSVPDVAALAGLVREQLPEHQACSFGAISHPTEEMLDRLGRCATATETTDALHAMGASPGDAAVVAAAFASCRARTEIVAVAHDDGVLTQSSGAVAILDTDKGRIVSSPSKSPDHRVWTTLSPGSGHRIGQAIGLMIETLPDGRWFPP